MKFILFHPISVKIKNLLAFCFLQRRVINTHNRDARTKLEFLRFLCETYIYTNHLHGYVKQHFDYDTMVYGQ